MSIEYSIELTFRGACDILVPDEEKPGNKEKVI